MILNSIVPYLHIQAIRGISSEWYDQIITSRFRNDVPIKSLEHFNTSDSINFARNKDILTSIIDTFFKKMSFN